MNKYILLLIMSTGLFSCTGKDVRYYQTHPKELQQALKLCPDKNPSAISCTKLQEIGMRLNELAYELQYSPQGFGKKIIRLQEKIASEENKLKTIENTPELNKSLEQNKKELADCLAVVKWLESPES